MPRPAIPRRVSFSPQTTYFKPAGLPLAGLGEAVLNLEGLEAVRLCDLEKLGQSEAAEQMGVSQPTLHRLLEKARETLADAIVNGKAIRVEGGNYEFYGATGAAAGRGGGIGRGRGRNRGGIGAGRRGQRPERSMARK